MRRVSKIARICERHSIFEIKTNSVNEVRFSTMDAQEVLRVLLLIPGQVNLHTV